MSCRSCKEKKTLVQKIKNIATGYVNLVIRTDENEALAKSRLAFCDVCPHAVEILKVNGRSINKCNLCTCPVEVKARVPNERCDDGKW